MTVLLTRGVELGCHAQAHSTSHSAETHVKVWQEAIFASSIGLLTSDIYGQFVHLFFDCILFLAVPNSRIPV
jgi:hypothetical protein